MYLRCDQDSLELNDELKDVVQNNRDSYRNGMEIDGGDW